MIVRLQNRGNPLLIKNKIKNKIENKIEKFKFNV